MYGTRIDFKNKVFPRATCFAVFSAGLEKKTFGEKLFDNIVNMFLTLCFVAISVVLVAWSEMHFKGPNFAFKVFYYFYHLRCQKENIKYF